MNITINVNIPALEDLARAIHVYSSATAYKKSGQLVDLPGPSQLASTQSVSKEEKPKKQAKDKGKSVKQVGAQSEADPVAETGNSTDETAQEQYIPTVVELRAKAKEKGNTPEEKKAIKSLLDKFNSKSISNVPEKDRAAFLSALEAL